MTKWLRVWDLPTRLFHWCLALLMIGSVVTAKIGGNLMQWHFYCGYAILTLVLFRIVWGFIGGRYARFSSFLFSPGSVLRYMRGHPDAPVTPGHNPVGSLSVFAMLLIVAFQASSGLFANDEIASEGPLAKHVSDDTSGLLTSLHHLDQYVIYTLVALHLLAIIGYRVFKKERLTRAMITGNKAIDMNAGHDGDRGEAMMSVMGASRDDAGSRVVALVVLGVCAGVVYAVVQA